MLAKTARWLAFLGYDAAYATEADHEDQGLLRRALEEDRIFLTRDTRIPSAAGLKMLVLREQGFQAQLKRVVSVMGLKPDPKRFFTRCTLCNVALEPVRRDDVLEDIPLKARSLDTSFHRCGSCRRLYWSGTHVERAVESLRDMGIEV